MVGEFFCTVRLSIQLNREAKLGRGLPSVKNRLITVPVYGRSRRRAFRSEPGRDFFPPET